MELSLEMPKAYLGRLSPAECHIIIFVTTIEMAILPPILVVHPARERAAELVLRKGAGKGEDTASSALRTARPARENVVDDVQRGTTRRRRVLRAQTRTRVCGAHMRVAAVAVIGGGGGGEREG